MFKVVGNRISARTTYYLSKTLCDIREFMIFKTQQMFAKESCCFTNDFSDPEVISTAQRMLMVYCNAVCHRVFVLSLLFAKNISQ